MEALPGLGLGTYAHMSTRGTLYGCLPLRHAKCCWGWLHSREATVLERERNRHEGRQMARRAAIGSTLLLKGLEQGCVIPPETMDARHLCVAMTRGSARLVICSATPNLIQ